jgi:hypothetical protein
VIYAASQASVYFRTGYIYYRQHNIQLVVMVFTTTCFDSHESSSGYVQNLLVEATFLLTFMDDDSCESKHVVVKTITTKCLLC